MPAPMMYWSTSESRAIAMGSRGAESVPGSGSSVPFAPANTPSRDAIKNRNTAFRFIALISVLVRQGQGSSGTVGNGSKVGNSNALILDKPLLELVGLKEGANVEITVDHGNIIISPVSPETISGSRTEELLNRIVQNRRSALEKPAK